MLSVYKLITDYLYLPAGGGGGIRTHVRQKGESGFQDRHHKPLGHPSWLQILLQNDPFRQSCQPFAGIST